MFESIKEWRGGFFSISLSVVVMLVIAIGAVSVYEAFTDTSSALSFIKNPEIVAIAIGLLVSILFVERWRSLDTKVDSISSEQQKIFKDLRESVDNELEIKLGVTIAHAETLQSQISDLVEKHPWLEAITDRDIYVETSSIRGIIRTCYSLLEEERLLHLHEYIDYHSQNGAKDDPFSEKRRGALRGTLDDYVELADFCELWLEDYYLSTEILARLAERSDRNSISALPIYLRKLIRSGMLSEAMEMGNRIRIRVFGQNVWAKLLLVLGLRTRFPETVRWRSYNSLALLSANIGRDTDCRRYEKMAQQSVCAEQFDREQKIWTAEIRNASGDASEAARLLFEALSNNPSLIDLNDIAFLLFRAGFTEDALLVRQRILARREGVDGDLDTEAPIQTSDLARKVNNNGNERKEAKSKTKRQSNERTSSDGVRQAEDLGQETGVGQRSASVDGRAEDDLGRQR